MDSHLLTFNKPLKQSELSFKIAFGKVLRARCARENVSESYSRPISSYTTHVNRARVKGALNLNERFSSPFRNQNER